MEQDKNGTQVATLDPQPNILRSDTEYKWYVLRAVSGKERKVEEYLTAEIRKNPVFSGLVNQVLLPMEKVFQMRNGKKVVRERSFYPGYILLEAAINGELVTAINQIPNVIDFLGKTNPTPLRKSEVAKILGQADDAIENNTSSAAEFTIGETIKVIDGAFDDFEGIIEEINAEKKKLKIMVKIFGRRTPLELNYAQVQKIK